MNTIGWPKFRSLNQEGIVFAIAVVVFVAAAIGLPGFIDPNNLVAIVRSVSVLGILALLLSWTILGGVVLGLLAIILGWVASRRARRGLASGRGMAITGIVLGVVGPQQA